MIRDLLKYQFNARTDNKASLDRRIFNVKAFSGLDRTGLSFQGIERRLQLFETSDNEKLYIQFPGKESARESNTKPWDFRPKLGKNDSFIKDLSFADIWDDISEMHEVDNESTAVLSAIFFRMAYLIGYEKVTTSCPYEDFDTATGNVVSSGSIEFTWYRPNFSQEVYDYMKTKIGSIRGFSPEAYFFYNDLLAQNEDCKYYYREEIEKKVEWKGKPGRENTLLSHLSCVEYITGHIKFSEIMGRFQRGMGVAPIPNRSISVITDGIIQR